MDDQELRRRRDAWVAQQERAAATRCDAQARIFVAMGFSLDELMVATNFGCPGSGEVVLRLTHDPEHRTGRDE